MPQVLQAIPKLAFVSVMSKISDIHIFIINTGMKQPECNLYYFIRYKLLLDKVKDWPCDFKNYRDKP